MLQEHYFATDLPIMYVYILLYWQDKISYNKKHINPCIMGEPTQSTLCKTNSKVPTYCFRFSHLV